MELDNLYYTVTECLKGKAYRTEDAGRDGYFPGTANWSFVSPDCDAEVSIYDTGKVTAWSDNLPIVQIHPDSMLYAVIREALLEG